MNAELKHISLPDQFQIVERPLTTDEFLEESRKLIDRVTSIYPGKQEKRVKYDLNGKGTVDIVRLNRGFNNFTLKYENSPEAWTTIQVAIDYEDTEDPTGILEFDYLNRIENSHMHLAWSIEAADAISQTLDHLGLPTFEELEMDRQFSMVGGVWGGEIPEVGSED